MKKLKYILASLLLASGFASCESEEIDGKLNDENLQSKPVLRFDLNNKVTVVTDNISLSWGGDAFIITAKMQIKDDNAISAETKYKAAKLDIYVSNLIMANFPAMGATPPTSFFSTAVMEVHELDEDGKIMPVSYSTVNAPEDASPGFMNVSFISQESRYLNGSFDYTLYPPEGSIMQPQKLTKGEVHYIKY